MIENQTQMSADQQAVVETFAPLDAISETLSERGKQYGEFKGHAEITQRIKRAMQRSRRWQALSDEQKEALEMIAHKIGRILHGNPDHKDSWHDIVGYAKLIDDTMK